MPKKPLPPDLVDWTLSQAPEPGEPASDSEPPPGARPLRQLTGSRGPGAKAVIRTGLGLAVVAAIALLVFKLSAAWDATRLQRGVEQAVAQEEESTRLGDLEKLAQLYPPEAGGWVAAQLARAQLGQPGPLPMTSLSPASEPPVVQSVTALSSNTARADVARRFFAPDGAAATFILPQFYQFADGAWRRIPPPATDRADLRAWTGRYVKLSYYTIDEPLMQELGPYLDEKLARICAAWDCPTSVKFDLSFLLNDVTPTRGFDYFSPAPATPLIFSLLLSEREAYWSSQTLPLAAPHLAGYPADAASRDVYRRLLALEILVRLVGDVAPARFQFSALPYALAARLSVALDLDAPAASAIDYARPIYTPSELWALRYVSTARPLGPFYTRLAQYQALAALNTMLAGQPAGDEAQLMHSLDTAQGPDDWLAAALGVSPAAAGQQFETVLAGQRQLPAAAAPPASGAITLSCRDGLASFSPGQTQPSYFLRGSFAEASPIAWAPGGARLLIEISGQLAVIEAASGQLTWLPATPDYFNQVEWVNPTVLAYTLWPRDLYRTAFEPNQFSLRFFDVAQPQHALPTVAAVQYFALAPDHNQMVVVRVDPLAAFERQGALALMPALGGPLTPLADEGLSPAWSPDGRTLLYAQLDDDSILVTLNLETLEKRRIFESGQWDRGGRPSNLAALWSPAGDRVSLALQGGFSGHFSVWSLRPDGSEPIMLFDGPAAAYTDPVHFSADGAYLAVTLWDPYWQRQTAIYNAATGAAGLRFANAGGWTAWSPTGHQLILSAYDGISLLTAPGDPHSQPQHLAGDVCNRVLWNSTP